MRILSTVSLTVSRAEVQEARCITLCLVCTVGGNLQKDSVRYVSFHLASLSLIVMPFLFVFALQIFYYNLTFVSLHYGSLYLLIRSHLSTLTNVSWYTRTAYGAFAA